MHIEHKLKVVPLRTINIFYGPHVSCRLVVASPGCVRIHLNLRGLGASIPGPAYL